MNTFKLNPNGVNQINNLALQLFERLANEVKEEAKLIVPVKTGKLRESIEINKEDQENIKIGSKVDYAIFVELGTIKQSAQPFLRPAIDNITSKYK
jgi:HK97 gp10 family phage protein